MAIRVRCMTDKGGAVEIGNDVTVSYAVTTVADLPPAELLLVWIKLTNGDTLQLFYNRESNLLVADRQFKDGTGGIEFVRKTTPGL